MADTPLAEDTLSTGKRKRSPGSLVHVPIPISLPRRPDSTFEDPFKQSYLDEHPLPKRPKLPSNSLTPSPEARLFIEDLPSGVLQHIFTYVDLPSFGRLILVNRRFRTLLDPSHTLPSDTGDRDVYSVRPQEAVWAAVRRKCLPTMPKPMAGLTERAQFNLSFGTKCQICRKSPIPNTLAHVNPWQDGPGLQGVRVIWPLRLRACADCLLPRLQKENEVLVSDASALRPGLPFAFFTEAMHFVSQTLLQEPLPLGIEPQKYYMTTDIHSLQAELEEARSCGPAAAGEWLKGLPFRGRIAQKDAGRFEQWEFNGGLAQAQAILARQKSMRFGQDSCTPVAHPLPNRPSVVIPPALVGSVTRPLSTGLLPMPTCGVAPGLESAYRAPERQSDSVSMGSQHSTGTQKATSSRERARIRSYKKADIISRCSRLNPPISKDMLERLGAFDAALKVPIHLNDNSWETLKGSLLKERHRIALEDGARNNARTAPIPGQFRPPAWSDEYVLAHTDTPRREKLCQIAEEFIKQKWYHGGHVNYPNAPRFAAEVLLHTRQAYIDEQTRIEKLQATTGFMKLSTPTEENLKLEDMKWVFEQSVKPRTEQIRKDLFLCPICPTGTPVKYFAFESIIQHHASKHTTAFSRGTQKVTWKADWPETSPFNTHPERVHTPEPSITHTPTLSQITPTVMSSGSAMPSTVSSAGWHTPDTMSLVSTSTHTLSESGRSVYAKKAETSSHFSMYEAQKTEFSAGLREGWNMTFQMTSWPASLRVYLSIAFAVAEFARRFSNTPVLHLFKDCVGSKSDLEDMRAIEHLKCAECLAARVSLARASWTLVDLVEHFNEAHLDLARGETNMDWKNEMIVLPEPTFIKSLQGAPSLPKSLHQLLQDAVRTSTIQFVQSEPSVFERTPQPQPFGSGQRSIEQIPSHEQTTRHFVSNLIERPRDPEYYIEQRGAYRHIFPSTAATYGDRSTTRDSLSSASMTIQGDEPFDDRYRHRPVHEVHDQPTAVSGHQHVVQFGSPLRAVVTSVEDSADIPRAETMTRTNTVRSYHSRSDQRPADTADDFLSTIDAHVDVEMSNAGLNQSRGSRTSRPASRPNSTVGLNSRISRHDSPNHLDDMTTREPSRLIEFDDNGTPVSHVGRVIQDTLPPQRSITRQYLEPPEVYRFESLSQPNYQYRAIRYVPTPAHQPEYRYDSATGQYYLIDPPPRRYNEIGEPRVSTLYDEQGRPVRYREVDERYTFAAQPYDRYSSAYDNPRLG